MSKLRTILLLTTAAILLFPAIAMADDADGCTFCGTASLDGSEVTGGTLVTAIINGDEYNTHTPSDGSSSRYCITIRPPAGKSYPDGTLVTFKVNGHPAAQTASFKAGSSIKLDLVASSEATGIPTISWLTISLIILLFIACAMACYLIYRIVEKRRKVATQGTQVKKEEVQSGQRSRYVWDSETLSWVPSTKSEGKTAQTTAPTRLKGKKER